MTLGNNVLTEQLREFLAFISEAHSFLKQAKVTKSHPDVLRIRSAVEEIYQDDRGKPAIYQKYESTLYEDAPAIVTLWSFFQTYDSHSLRRYYKLTLIELAGLRGDHHPMAILGRSVLGTGALLISAITVWWGLIKVVSADVSENFLLELLHDIFGPTIENRLVGVVFIVGMFVVVWYALRMVRNRKQVAFLSSLSRALKLYLDDI